MKSVKWQEFVEEINILGGLFIVLCGMKSPPSFFCKEFNTLKCRQAWCWFDAGYCRKAWRG